LQVVCLHKASQPIDLSLLDPDYPANDPDASAYYLPVYEAEIWSDEDGEVNLQKRAVGRNAAPAALPNHQNQP
jgi:hypothetical protein